MEIHIKFFSNRKFVVCNHKDFLYQLPKKRNHNFFPSEISFQKFLFLFYNLQDNEFKIKSVRRSIY